MIGRTNAYNNSVAPSQTHNTKYLYYLGNEDTSETGTWEAVSINGDPSYPSVGSLTKYSDHMRHQLSGSGVAGASPSNAIDLTGYKGIAWYNAFSANSATWSLYQVLISKYNYPTTAFSYMYGEVQHSRETRGYDFDFVNINTNFSVGYPVTYNNYSGYVDIKCCAMYKTDDIGVLASYGSTISEIIANAENLLSNKKSVEKMVVTCTGEFMWRAIASTTFRSALQNSVYKSIVLANEEWAKALQLVI